jgi:hypothetical protein
VIGEDAIYFDLTLKAVNRFDNTATLVVRHVPPEKPEIRLPANWMRKLISDTVKGRTASCRSCRQVEIGCRRGVSGNPYKARRALIRVGSEESRH